MTVTDWAAEVHAAHVRLGVRLPGNWCEGCALLEGSSRWPGAVRGMTIPVEPQGSVMALRGTAPGQRDEPLDPCRKVDERPEWVKRASERRLPVKVVGGAAR